MVVKFKKVDAHEWLAETAGGWRGSIDKVRGNLGRNYIWRVASPFGEGGQRKIIGRGSEATLTEAKAEIARVMAENNLA